MGVVDIIDTVEMSLLSFPKWEGVGPGMGCVSCCQEMG